MSHIVVIKTEIRDLAALNCACRRLDLPPPKWETVRLFEREATGHCVRLRDWRWPVVCDLKEGRVQFDNFEGRWGHRRELDRLVQRYAAEKAKLEARKQGHSVTEQTLSDGSIKLCVHVGDTT